MQPRKPSTTLFAPASGRDACGMVADFPQPLQHLEDGPAFNIWGSGSKDWDLTA